MQGSRHIRCPLRACRGPAACSPPGGRAGHRCWACSLLAGRAQILWCACAGLRLGRRHQLRGGALGAAAGGGRRAPARRARRRDGRRRGRAEPPVPGACLAASGSDAPGGVGPPWCLQCTCLPWCSHTCPLVDDVLQQKRSCKHTRPLVWSQAWSHSCQEHEPHVVAVLDFLLRCSWTMLLGRP